MTDGNNTPVAPDTIRRLMTAVPQALAMLAGLQLGVFTRLAGGPLTATALARDLGVAEARLVRLLDALTVVGLLERRAEKYANTPEASAFLVKGAPNDLGGSHELVAQLWQADLMTAESILTGAPAALHDFAHASDDELMAMLRGMHADAVASGRDLARRFDFSDCRSVADIGGGSGGLVAALCLVYPGLRGVVFELPRSAALARRILATEPGGERVAVESGDILKGPPRDVYDAVVMRALIQVLGPGEAARAIVNAASKTRPGGWVYILGGGILDEDRLGPPMAVFLNLTFLNLYRAGTSYTESQYAHWLAAAGCGAPERLVLPSGGGLIRARKLR
jgi:O-methyltransferase domain/Dimerisation domain